MTIRKESKQYIRQQRKIDADLVKRPNEILKRTTDDGNLKLTFKSPTYYEKDIVVTKNAMLSSTPLIKTYASLESFESFILDLEGQEIITYNLTQNTTITDVINYNNGMSYKLYLKQDEVGGKLFVFDETISNITLFDNFQIDQTPNSITQIKIDVVEDTLYVQSYIKYIKNLNSFEFTINTTLGTGSSFTLPLAENYNYDMMVDWGDGETSTITSFEEVDKLHTYSTSGEYQVKITGICEYFAFNNGGDRLKLIELNSFNGDCGFKVLNFWGCTNLAGEIPKSFTNLHKLETAERLFQNCSNLTGGIPEDMFWNSKNINHFGFTFRSCTKLTGNIPEKLFYNNPLVTTFTQTFILCTNLSGNIPEKLFANNPLVTDFSYTFYGCTKLEGSIPEKLFWNNPLVTSFSYIFTSCINLTGSIPEKLFWNNPLVVGFYMTLGTPITNEGMKLSGSIPENMFINNKNVETFRALFNNCTNLTGNIPGNLFINNDKVSNFINTFWNCNQLTGDGWRNIISNAEQNAVDGGFSLSTSFCFNGCTSLTDYAQIPGAWK